MKHFDLLDKKLNSLATIRELLHTVIRSHEPSKFMERISESNKYGHTIKKQLIEIESLGEAIQNSMKKYFEMKI